ncbi:MAG: RluA family pseudouridine synthase [Rickettsiales bacterium]|nr:RluA family pseudouridine synthase [Rickettsiales bacterium]
MIIYWRVDKDGHRSASFCGKKFINHHSLAVSVITNISIGNKQDGLRLDKFVSSRYDTARITDITRFIKRKEIKVNGRRVEAKHILREGDTIVFSEFIEKILKNPARGVKNNADVSKKYNNLITNSTIFEDDNILVIDKPYGLAVQGGSGIDMSIDKIIGNFKLVHRLDKDTTGVLLIAKNLETSNELTKMFKNKGKIKKEYLLLSCGKIKNANGTISFPLLKKYENNIEKVYVDSAKGKEAVTNYEVLQYLKKNNISFVRAEILTGRTHQIRAHFKEIGHPVLGDFKYGKKEFNAQSGKLQLHSWRTTINLFGKDFVFMAKLPEHMKKFVGNF